MASGSHQVLIGDYYDVSQAKVSQCLSQVSTAIARLSIRYIQFPTMNGVYKDMTSFQEIGGMPSVVGCIDCTHIKIVRPRRNDTEIFRCRKGYFSLNVQAICGPSLIFYSVVCRWPGSVHDSRIFDNSTIRDVLEDGRLPCHLLGDSGYPCRRYLLTPLLSPNGPHEAAYNASHIKTRNCIERAFGVLKRRFCYLGQTVRTSLDTTKAIIVAAMVLHNKAVLTNIDLEEPNIDAGVHHDVHMANVQRQGNAAVQGRLKRAQIIREYF